MIDAASGVSPYASLHLPTTVLSRATPQDVAVLSVQAIQLGETDALFSHSLSNQVFATQAATDGAISNTNPLPSLVAGMQAGPSASAAEETPQQMLAGLQLQTVQALYGGQDPTSSTFSLIG